jgi:hypothetical protein
MVKLRVDTWDAEYGSSYDAVELADPDEPSIRPVEVRDWVPVCPRDSELPSRIGFIDGVRRIDVRLFAEDGAGLAPALAGSWAVGIAWGGRPPGIGGIRLGRELVVGGGLAHPPLSLEIGRSRIRYAYRSAAGITQTDPILGLQNAMRQAEAELAQRIAVGDGLELLVLDGPLTYFASAAPVVGMIKRQVRSYLSADQAAILAELRTGDRSPIFLLGEQRLERYSWYCRIGARRPIDGVMTGIVRLEASAVLGLAEAVRLADATACALPRYATQIGRDPRAPQNLYPIARLEAELHHHLGDAAVIKRGLEALLWREHA